jgi:hypothetical protein
VSEHLPQDMSMRKEEAQPEKLPRAIRRTQSQVSVRAASGVESMRYGKTKAFLMLQRSKNGHFPHVYRLDILS